MLFKEEYDNIRDDFIAHAEKEHNVRIYNARFCCPTPCMSHTVCS